MDGYMNKHTTRAISDMQRVNPGEKRFTVASLFLIFTESSYFTWAQPLFGCIYEYSDSADW